MRTRTGQKTRRISRIHLQMLPNILLQPKLAEGSCLIPPVLQAHRLGGSVPAFPGVLLAWMEESCAILLRTPALPGTYLKGIGLAPWDEALFPHLPSFSKFLHFNKIIFKSGSYKKKIIVKV